MYANINSRGYVIFRADAPINGAIALALPETATEWTAFRYKYADGAWTDAFPGVADDAFMAEYDILNTSWSLADAKSDKIPSIKRAAAGKINALDWKIQRATEQDAINGTSTLAAVYAEREAIRVASGTKEAALAAISNMDDIWAFDPADF
jgi:hypothetical protein